MVLLNLTSFCHVLVTFALKHEVAKSVKTQKREPREFQVRRLMQLFRHT